MRVIRSKRGGHARREAPFRTESADSSPVGSRIWCELPTRFAVWSPDDNQRRDHRAAAGAEDVTGDFRELCGHFLPTLAIKWARSPRKGVS